MKDLLGETAAIAQEELSKKQETLEELQTALRANSSKLAETRRNVEAVKEKLRQQQINRQQVANLSHELERLQYSMGHVDNAHASAQSNSAAAWEDELDTAIKSGKPASTLPDAILLRARLKATTDVLSSMRDKVSGLQGSSRDFEYKYRRLVSLAANCSEEQVDDLLQSLVRAVQSEKGELEIGRVRKFLGGVEVNSA